MATIRLALIPAKVLSDGSHKICIAIHHKEETKYIVTRFKVDSLSQFKNGQVVKRPDAALINRLSLKPWGIALKFLFLHHENILFPND